MSTVSMSAYLLQMDDGRPPVAWLLCPCRLSASLGPVLFSAGSERWLTGERLRIGAANPLGRQIAVGHWLRRGAAGHVLRVSSGRMGGAAKLDGTGSEQNCIKQGL